MSYLIHTIDFLNNPALADLPDDTAGMGVLRASEVGGPVDRCTFLVDRDYALMLVDACRHLEGAVALAESAVRFVRLGWPEEWPHPELPTGWAPIYPDGAEVVQ